MLENMSPVQVNSFMPIVKFCCTVFNHMVLICFCPFSCAKDIEVYVKALEDCLLRIPSNSLSKVHILVFYFYFLVANMACPICKICYKYLCLKI
jgi:hypothetical protein